MLRPSKNKNAYYYFKMFLGTIRMTRVIRVDTIIYSRSTLDTTLGTSNTMWVRLEASRIFEIVMQYKNNYILE